MSTLEKMSSHTRLYRRNATYYHRAVVLQDIIDTYGKTEETFSLKTKDHSEALRRIKIEAVRVDELFEVHRSNLIRQSEPPLNELSPAQIKHCGEAYYSYILEEDDENRLDGFDEFIDTDSERQWISDFPETPRKTFEEHQEDIDDLNKSSRYATARGQFGRVTELCRSFNRILCTKGDYTWNTNPPQSINRKLYALH